MQATQAALKLCQNLLDQLEPEDAKKFAAFVLAKITIDTGSSIEHSLRLLSGQWAELLLSTIGDGNKTIDSGNCTCLAVCVVKHTPEGPLVIHYGGACGRFKDRFPFGGPTRAQDGMGWDNWTDASEKHAASDSLPKGDDSTVRFGLLELK